MWILILTIATGFGPGSRGNTSAIAPVPGFASAALCQSAGNSWVATQAKRGGGSGWNFNAVCVEAR